MNFNFLNGTTEQHDEFNEIVNAAWSVNAPAGAEPQRSAFDVLEFTVDVEWVDDPGPPGFKESGWTQSYWESGSFYSMISLHNELLVEGTVGYFGPEFYHEVILHELGHVLVHAMIEPHLEKRTKICELCGQTPDKWRFGGPMVSWDQKVSETAAEFLKDALAGRPEDRKYTNRTLNSLVLSGQTTVVPGDITVPVEWVEFIETFAAPSTDPSEMEYTEGEWVWQGDQDSFTLYQGDGFVIEGMDPGLLWRYYTCINIQTPMNTGYPVVKLLFNTEGYYDNIVPQIQVRESLEGDMLSYKNVFGYHPMAINDGVWILSDLIWDPSPPLTGPEDERLPAFVDIVLWCGYPAAYGVDYEPITMPNQALIPTLTEMIPIAGSGGVTENPLLPVPPYNPPIPDSADILIRTDVP